jgi:hypothetical protein
MEVVRKTDETVRTFTRDRSPTAKAALLFKNQQMPMHLLLRQDRFNALAMFRSLSHTSGIKRCILSEYLEHVGFIDLLVRRCHQP